jgi:hypothetical protein
VAVSVVGPFEPKSSKCLYDRGTVDVTFRRKTGSISMNKYILNISKHFIIYNHFSIFSFVAVHDKMLEGIMQSTCEEALIVEQYPRTSIAVTVQEMQDRGNVCRLHSSVDNFFILLFIFSY